MPDEPTADVPEDEDPDEGHTDMDRVLDDDGNPK